MGTVPSGESGSGVPGFSRFTWSPSKADCTRPRTTYLLSWQRPSLNVAPTFRSALADLKVSATRRCRAQEAVEKLSRVVILRSQQAVLSPSARQETGLRPTDEGRTCICLRTRNADPSPQKAELRMTVLEAFFVHPRPHAGLFRRSLFPVQPYLHSLQIRRRVVCTCAPEASVERSGKCGNSGLYWRPDL